MFSILSQFVPSKKDLIIFGIFLLLFVCIFVEYRIIKSKDDTITSQSELIKAKELELSIQKSTIETLDKSYKESIEKIKVSNDKMNEIEKEYQSKLDNMILNLGNCRTDIPSDQLTEKTRIEFQNLLNDLSKSTVLKR